MGDAFLEAYEYAERLANRIEAIEADLARLRAENEALRMERDELDALYHEGGTWEQQLSEAEAALAAAEAKAARLETALVEIRDLRERPYTEFPSDWTAQIAACSECQSYRGHPIQQGICNQHRKPLYARDGHDAHETSILGIRARDIARAALEAKP